VYIRELISNSIDATATEISEIVKSDQIIFRDNGIGMDY
jgi:DNA mismatch repair ATPase MutL